MKDADVSDEDLEQAGQKRTHDMPPAGYTVLLSMALDRRPVVVRREDGFEKRVPWRCGRCRLVVGYDILADGSPGEGKGKERDGDVKVLYLLPAGVMSTDVMVAKKRIVEGDVEICVEGGRAAVAVFE